MPRIFVVCTVLIAFLSDLGAIPLSESLNSLGSSSNTTNASIVIVQGGIGKKAAQSQFLWPVAQITDATTVGRNIMQLTNPSAISFLKINADSTVSTRTAAQFLSDIGAQPAGSYLATANNLSDVGNVPTSRS